MQLLSDPHVYGLFNESNYGTSVHSYNREAGARVLEAILAENNLSASEVLAVSRGDDFVAVCTTGVGVGDEYGMFKKRLQLGKFIRWETVGSVALTEPGFKIFGVELRGRDGSALLAQSWNSVSEGLPERDRLVAIMARLVDAPASRR